MNGCVAKKKKKKIGFAIQFCSLLWREVGSCGNEIQSPERSLRNRLQTLFMVREGEEGLPLTKDLIQKQ